MSNGEASPGARRQSIDGDWVPRATYRLQLHRDFTFSDAEQLLPYLDALGISHVYTSPLLKARAGSPHGYDVTDHNAFNPELGDEHSFNALVAALARRDMGLILDFVCNHMGIGKTDNYWWLDVLEWGQASPYAAYFDIDWYPATAPLRGKVLLPFLGEPYGHALEEGQLQLGYDAEAGSFAVRYFDHLYPIAPRHYGDILSGSEHRHEADPTLQSLIAAFRTLRTSGQSRRRQNMARQQATELKQRLAALARQETGVREGIEQSLTLYNGQRGQPDSFLRLHRLLERQSYRLAFWRVAADEINYRRFFDINELAGIRVEHEAVFDAVHRLILRLLHEGKLQGLRIDHIDGLYDPGRYCQRLRAAAPRPFYLLVEKILATQESLRDEWPVAGTTGYDSLNSINALFVPPAAEQRLQRFYRRFTGRTETVAEVLITAKRHIIEHLLSSEMQVLANAFARLAASNWRTRDFTLPLMRSALTEVVVHFPVYRTYVTATGASDADRRDIDRALEKAQRANRQLEPELFGFIRGVLNTELAAASSGYKRIEVLRLAMKFQQYTGPVMAKSLEDTAFYRHVPLLSLNEVGGDPGQFGGNIATFHRITQERAQQWPATMISTGTHDSKRGEDARARINVLAELPQEWTQQVRHWAKLNRGKRALLDDAFAPDRNEEYLLYQTLVGSWPAQWLGDARIDIDALEAYCQRIQNYMVKTLREAKLHSAWARPDEAYEAAVREFVRRLLLAGDNPFLSTFTAFMTQIAPLGAVNALAQAVLKFTVPGVPDLYQGSELWDLNLVDPDNRRPVDYRLRREMLTTLQDRSVSPGLAAELCATWPDGCIKLYLIWRLLDLHRACARLFREGDYCPQEVTGRFADGVCAFARRYDGAQLVTVVPVAGNRPLHMGTTTVEAMTWEDTAVRLPSTSSGEWIDVFTHCRYAFNGEGNCVPLSALFATLPVAVLVTPACSGFSSPRLDRSGL